MAPKHMYDSAKAHARKDALKAKKAAAKKAGDKDKVAKLKVSCRKKLMPVK